MCVFITCDKINDLREKKMFERKSYHTNVKNAFLSKRFSSLSQNQRLCS